MVIKVALIHFVSSNVSNVIDFYIILFNTGLLIGSRKKSQIYWDFQGQTLGKNGQFCRKFMGIFSKNFAGK